MRQNLEQDGNMRALPHRPPLPPPRQPTHTPYSRGSAASAQTSRILHTSLGPPDPAPPSPGSPLCTSEWLPCSTPHPRPHTLLFLLLVLVWTGRTRPAAGPQGRPRLSPTTRPRWKVGGAKPAERARGSRLNRCPSHRPSPRAPAGTPPAGRRRLRTPQPRSPGSPGPSPLRRGPSLCRLCFPARLDLSRLTS